jgi:hypothetical protein
MLLAAALVNIGVVGTAPAWAAAPQPTSAVATPDHHHHDGHRHHGRHHEDGRHDDDGHGHGDGHQHRCVGLVVVCLG